MVICIAMATRYNAIGHLHVHVSAKTPQVIVYMYINYICTTPNNIIEQTILIRVMGKIIYNVCEK